MAGDLRQKERTIATLTTTGASIATGSAAAAGTAFDARSGGNAPDDFQAQFELVCQWATINGIVKDTVAAVLHLVPKLDGTNAPTMDTTAGAYVMPSGTFVDVFTCTKAPTANTDMRFITNLVTIAPRLYDAYVLNKSGQVISANWSLKVVSDQGQYT
jgi:hypothetical protein